MDPAVPSVLRSRRALAAEGVRFEQRGTKAPSALPITAEGATYTMAQEAVWLDERHFAVGRWDGSLSVFAWNESATRGPLITTAASDPTSEGVQMITPLGSAGFATSGGESALGVWQSSGATWAALDLTEYPYDPALGAANSGAVVRPAAGPSLLVVGHASGFISVWAVATNGTLALRTTLDLRNPDPVNPWNLHNIRGVRSHADRFVVTGSEDGYISVVDVLRMQVVSQTVYNPAARRGINSVALAATGDLLIANCSVGEDDCNLWYFTLDRDAIPVARHSANLKVDPDAPQVFNFSTVWANTPAGPCFFSSTEEGALWMGTVSAGKLKVDGYKSVTTPLGSVLSYQPGGRMALVGHDLYEFQTGA